MKVHPDGSWRSEPEVGIPELVLRAEDRIKILRGVAELFSRWVLEGPIYRLSHAGDPPWDDSGELRALESTPEERLRRYRTLGRWADEAYTGGSMPTFQSGMGLYHPTFDSEVEAVIRSGILALWTKGMSREQRDEFLDKDPESTSIDLEFGLIEKAGKMLTHEAWQLGEEGARESIIRETQKLERIWAKRREEESRAQSFRERFLADIPLSFRVEASNSRPFLERLSKILELADLEDLQALISKGLPGNISNSVKERIKTLATQRQSERHSGKPSPPLPEA